jgi:hypothetical protein
VASMTGSPACNKKVNFSKRKVLILLTKRFWVHLVSKLA